MDRANHLALDRLTVGLGKGAALTLITYFDLKVVALAHGHHWGLLGSNYGIWFLVEMTAFVLVPCFLFVFGVRNERVGVVRLAAVFAILGILANRFTVSMFAFGWELPHRNFFYWKEILVVATIVTIEIVVYRWIIIRLPVHRRHPGYPETH